MSYTEKSTIAFLKDMGLQIEHILKDAEGISIVIENLYKDYVQFLEDNHTVSHLEIFKNLEKDLRSLCQTCKFIPNDCRDIRHSLAEAAVNVISIN